jgi:hypothetical protein
MTHAEGSAKHPASLHVRALVWDHQGVSESSQRSPRNSARDILAAEAFAVPAPDPRLRRDLVLPGDPTGIAEPHDILAAEEFAMPVPEAVTEGGRLAGAAGRGRAAKAGLAGVMALLLWRRRGSA